MDEDQETYLVVPVERSRYYGLISDSYDLAEARLEIGSLRSENVELQRRALAVTRMWDALGRCEDEFPPGDPEVAVCAELQERLDTAIDGLMKLVDREMWDRRQAWMREAAVTVCNSRPASAEGVREEER